MIRLNAKVVDKTLIITGRNMELRIQDAVNLNWFSEFFLQLFAFFAVTKSTTRKRQILVEKTLEDISRMKGLN